MRWSFDWSPGEYRRAGATVQRHRGRSPVLSIGRVLAWLLFGAVVFGVGSALVSREYDLVLDMLPGAILIVALLAFLRWGMPWVLVLAQPKKAKGRREFWVNEDGIGQSNPLGSSTSGWEAIERVIETADFMLFYYSISGAYFVPKRLIEPQDLGELRRLASERSAFRNA